MAATTHEGDQDHRDHQDHQSHQGHQGHQGHQNHQDEGRGNQPENLVRRLEDRETPMTLEQLEQRMDRSLALQALNHQQSRLLRLPPEIMLLVLHQLADVDDSAGLLCLRRCCRSLRQVAYDRELQPYLPCLNFRPDQVLERPGLLRRDQRRELGLRLRRDGLCASCKPLEDFFAFSSRIGRIQHTSGCKIAFNRSGLQIYCDGCHCNHDQRAFNQTSLLTSTTTPSSRYCMGRQGAVRLCEHVSITLDMIEEHISKWRSRSKISTPLTASDLRTCLEGFLVECRHPDHSTSSDGTHEEESCPRATLDCGDTWGLVLRLAWKPHYYRAGTTDDGVDAEEMRAMFQAHRRIRSPAHYLFPSTPRDPLPEMKCFNHQYCDCLAYRGYPDEFARIAGFIDEEHRFTAQEHELRADEFFHTVHRDHNYHGFCSVDSVELSKMPSGEERECLVTKYERQIELNLDRDGGYVSPTAEWFDCMDPLSYTTGRLRCFDGACMNNVFRPPRKCECMDE